MPSHPRVPGGARRRYMRLLFPALASSLVIPASLAATATAAPQASTTCGGGLTATPTTDEPNQLGYKFNCSNAITAYSIIANRGIGYTGQDDSVIDDFSTTAIASKPDGSVDPSGSLNCEGTLPGNGINCHNGGAIVPPGEYITGNFDLTDPYCANIAPGSPPGTRPEPQAFVQLIVTDNSGAQNGPFTLGLSPACGPTPPPVPFPKPKPKHKHKHKKGHH